MGAPLTPSAAAPGRVLHLDGLRGIAALVVVLHHAILAVPSGNGVAEIFDRFIGFRMVSLGRPAVILFFVLSGFVLTRGLHSRSPNLVMFAARRALRLLPAYWIAIVLSFVAFCLLPRHTAGGMSIWFNSQWGGGLTVNDLLCHLAMLAGPRQYPLDHVAWSLVHELRLSILLPVFALFYRRFGLLPCVMVAGLVAIGAEAYIYGRPEAFPLGANGFLFDAPGLGASLVLSARFGLDFAIGFALASHWTSIEAAFARRSWLHGPVLGVALCLLSIRTETAMAFGAACLIASVASSRCAATLLNRASVAWVGRVSYSLYLIHLPIMLTIGILLDGIVQPQIAMAIAILAALPAAEVLCRLVEEPSMRWSRALSGAKAPVLSTQPALATA